MWNKYEAKKTAKTGGFENQSQVTREAVAEVLDDDGNVVRAAEAEETREFVSYVVKQWDAETGEAQADSKREINLAQLENEKARFDNDQAKAKEQSDGLAKAIADFKKL